MNLTESEQNVLDYVKEYIRKNCFSPSLGDIAHDLHFSRTYAHNVIESLCNKNCLTRIKNIARSYVLKQ